MKRYLWLTDLHLNFLGKDQVATFLKELKAQQPTALWIGGDISEAVCVIDDLKQIAHTLAVPIYFVLGNHDYYRGSIAQVRWEVEELCEAEKNLHWLSNQAAPIEIAPDTALIGHDGWGDGRLGDPDQAISLNDDILIRELAMLIPRSNQFRKLQALGDEAADHLRRLLPPALEKYQHIYVLTHVPPFREACWHAGQLSDERYLPRFACKAVGDVLSELMQAHPTRQMTVLCGHTHGAGQAQILPNLQALTGGAEYGDPRIQQIIRLG